MRGRRAQRTALLALALAVGCDGCLSYGGGTGYDDEEGGGCGPRRWPAGRRDAAPEAACTLCAPRDAGRLPPPEPTCRPEDRDGCGCLGPYRRCDCGCEGPGLLCLRALGLCVPADPEHEGFPALPMCTLYHEFRPDRGDGGVHAYSNGCPADRYCVPGLRPLRPAPGDGGVAEAGLDGGLADAGALDGRAGDDEAGLVRLDGYCLPLETCLALAEAAEQADGGLGDAGAEGPDGGPPRCFYDDATPLRRGPPTAPACPEQTPFPQLPFCGGTCGPIDCGVLSQCAWLSETRSFGVCTLGFWQCAVDNPQWTAASLETCAESAGERCLCLAPSPQPGRPAEVGWAVPMRLCALYRSDFPESVRCLDAQWNPVL